MYKLSKILNEIRVVSGPTPEMIIDLLWQKIDLTKGDLEIQGQKFEKTNNICKEYGYEGSEVKPFFQSLTPSQRSIIYKELQKIK